MALRDDMAADLAELEIEMAPDGENAETFTWPVGGSDYKCVRGSVRRGKTLGSGGYSLDADLVLYVRTELLATRPTPKQLLTYGDRNFRIDDVVTVAAGEAFIKLVCTDPNQRL